MADHEHPLVSGFVVRRVERPSVGGFDAESFEKSLGHQRRRNVEGSSRFFVFEGVGPGRRDAPKDPVLVSPVAEVCRRHAVPFYAVRQIVLPQPIDAARIRILRRLQENGVHDAEYPGVGADSKRKREDGDRCESRISPQLSKAERQVLLQLVEVFGASHIFLEVFAYIVALDANLADVAESPTGFLSGARGIRSAFDQLTRSHVQVKPQFAVDVRIDVATPEVEVTPPHRCVLHAYRPSSGL